MYLQINKMKHRPPLGLLPIKLWQEDRRSEIEAAIIRYVLEDIPIPREWVRELKTLNSWIETEPIGKPIPPPSQSIVEGKDPKPKLKKDRI